MNQVGRLYPSDLTDQQWEIIKELIPPARAGGRRRTTDVRHIINAVLYLTRTGCAWRYLPKDYPHWKTVYHYFSRWRDYGIWRKIHLHLAKQARTYLQRSQLPSTIIIDSQSVRAQYGEERGWDGFKKVRGRKREILVDTVGILWGSKVHAANQGENRRAFEAIVNAPEELAPQRLLGDNGYSRVPFTQSVLDKWGIFPDIVRGTKPTLKDEKSRPVKVVGQSNLKPQRWIVERSFAWFNNYRRLSRDYERKTANSEVFLFISQVPILLNKLNL